MELNTIQPQGSTTTLPASPTALHWSEAAYTQAFDGLAAAEGNAKLAMLAGMAVYMVDMAHNKRGMATEQATLDLKASANAKRNPSVLRSALCDKVNILAQKHGLAEKSVLNRVALAALFAERSYSDLVAFVTTKGGDTLESVIAEVTCYMQRKWQARNPYALSIALGQVTKPSPDNPTPKPQAARITAQGQAEKATAVELEPEAVEADAVFYTAALSALTAAIAAVHGANAAEVEQPQAVKDACQYLLTLAQRIASEPETMAKAKALAIAEMKGEPVVASPEQLEKLVKKHAKAA